MIVENLLFAGIVVASVVAFWNRAHRHNAAVRKQWSAAAEQLGLQFSSGRFGSFRISGHLEEVRIEVKPYDSAITAGAMTVCALADPPQPISHIFTLAPKQGRFAKVVDDLLASAERKTGDEKFDSTFCIEGTEIETLAGLSLPVRRALLRLAEVGTPAVESGLLRLWLSGIQFEPDEIAEILLAMAQAASGLSLGGRQQSLQQLTAIARTDPLWGVRHRCLEALVEVAGQSAFCNSALQSALEDSSPEVRYLAAIQPRVEGVAVLRQLVMSTSATEELRAKALRRLAQRLSDTEILPCLESLLGSRDVTVRHTAFEVAEHVKHRPLAKRLLTLLDPQDLKGAERIARAVANIGGPENEAELLDLLDWEAEPVRIAAARALGQVGTIRCVEKLMQRSQPRLLERSAFSIAVRSAVREIQSRAAGASAGQLSIAQTTDDSGALSFPAETGTLMISPDDPGRQTPPHTEEPTRREPD